MATPLSQLGIDASAGRRPYRAVADDADNNTEQVAKVARASE
jgi:hypothetical protein